MNSEPAVVWEYFNRGNLEAWQRRRKPIGRVEVGAGRWAEFLCGGVGAEFGETFVGDMLAALRWLRAGEPFARGLRLWLLSNGGFYFAPLDCDRLRLARWDRWFDETLTADGAGLCSTELAINRHLCGVSERWFPDQRVRLLATRLESYREQHPEAAAIRRVLD